MKNFFKHSIEKAFQKEVEIYAEECQIEKIKNKKIRDFFYNTLNKLFDFDEIFFNSIIDEIKHVFPFQKIEIIAENFLVILNFYFKKLILNEKEKNFFNKEDLSIEEKLKMLRNLIDEKINQHFLFLVRKRINTIKQSTAYKNLAKINYLIKICAMIDKLNKRTNNFFDFSKSELIKTPINVLKKMETLLKQIDLIDNICKILGSIQKNNSNREFEIDSSQIFKSASKKISNSSENNVGIKLGSEISKILKYQFAYRKRKNLDRVFKLNFIEKKLLEMDQESKILEEKIINKKVRTKQKGPFIICVDTSGSMSGHPETVAKAFAILISKVAIKEKRKCFLINFSTSLREIDLSNINNNLEALYNFLAFSFWGGTDIEMVLRRVVEKNKENEYYNADTLIISDMYFSISNKSLIEDIAKMKQNGNKLYAISIVYSPEYEYNEFFDKEFVFCNGKFLDKSIDDLKDK